MHTYLSDCFFGGEWLRSSRKMNALSHYSQSMKNDIPTHNHVGRPERTGLKFKGDKTEKKYLGVKYCQASIAPIPLYVESKQ